MKMWKRALMLLLCAAMLQTPAVTTVQAAETTTETTIQNGWDAEKKFYYRDGQKLTGINVVEGAYYYFDATAGKMTNKVMKAVSPSDQKTYYFSFDAEGKAATNELQKINGAYYYFDKYGRAISNKIQKLTVNGKTNYYYFGKNRKLAKAPEDDLVVYNYKTVKIGSKTYAYDQKGVVLVNGVRATADGKVYYYNSKGVYDKAKSKKLQKVVKYDKISKTALKDVKKNFGKPKKTVKDKNTCNPFGKYSRKKKYFYDVMLDYKTFEVHMTYCTKTKQYKMSGAFAKTKEEEF